MDFGALPPEINSTLIYTGPGAAPMMAAAAAWSGLGAELNTTASSYESVITTLTSEEWRGPASAAMAAAAAPYAAWLHTTAAAAERAATQATASAAAFQSAFAMTVPPPVVAANRAQLAALVATNFLGQNSAAIAACEALYYAMWAQDAAAMYGYAAASASAGVLDPLRPPAQSTTPTALAGSASGVQTELAQLVSTLPGAAQGMASPLAAPPGFVTDTINATQNIGLWNSLQTYAGAVGNVAAWNMFAGISAGAGLAHAHGLGLGAIGAAGGAVLVGTTAPAGSVGSVAAPVSATLARASSIGELSVPASWSAATPAGSAGAALAGSGWTAPVEDSMPVSAVPAGMPAVASAGRGGFGFGAPRYGVKPTVMARPVVGG